MKKATVLLISLLIVTLICATSCLAEASNAIAIYFLYSDNTEGPANPGVDAVTTATPYTELDFSDIAEMTNMLAARGMDTYAIVANEKYGELGLPGFLVGLELQDVLIAVEQPHIASDTHALEACDLVDAFYPDEPGFTDFRDLHLVRDPVIEVFELFLKEKGAAFLPGSILRPGGEDKLFASVDPFNAAGADAFETADDVAVALSKLYHETSFFLPAVQGLFCCCGQIVLWSGRDVFLRRPMKAAASSRWNTSPSSTASPGSLKRYNSFLFDVRRIT